MKDIIFTIFTNQLLIKDKLSESFFNVLIEKGLIPTKVGTTEPLRKDYSINDALAIWNTQRDGCYDVLLSKMVGRSGSFMGKSSDPAFLIDVQWWDCPNMNKLNYINIFFSAKTFKQKRELILTLFKESIFLFEGVYGYITHKDPKDRQHVTGTPNTRISGVFWCNYYSNSYMSYMNCADKIQSFHWWKSEHVENGIITYLAEEPNKELLSSSSQEILAKEHLGQDAFISNENRFNI